MTEQQQSACAELARRVGWREGELAGIWFPPDGGIWFPPDGNLKRVQTDPPDYFTDAVASRELVAWLAAQEVIVKRRFIANLHPGLSDACVFNDAPIDEDMILEALAAELPVIARAACKALGVEVSE